MKKIALLNAFTPAEEKELQISEREQFQAFLDLVDHDFRLTEFRVTEGDFPSTAAGFDGYLITGSPSGAYEEYPWIQMLSEFILQARAADKKLVGICFGHQILAQALGGRVEKSQNGWGLGLHALDFYDPPSWMAQDIPSRQGHFYFCHQDQVIDLPQGAQRLAGSSFCPNGMFMIDDQVLALQAHPEFTSQTMVKAIDGLQTSLTATQIKEATQSIGQQGADNQKAARWVVRFLSSE
ncbi:MAG: type 1 glutamine amidotransferase [Ardenticatenaceae bacterium]|nr:type 1 glutamine amidotransferase [Ardenticatenaceae bacterium]